MATKVTRMLRLYESSPALLEMTIGAETFDYFLTPIDGLTFELRKLISDGGDIYRVRLDGKRTTCSCKGFSRWKHCKHCDAIQALQREGRLPRLPLKAKTVCAAELQDL